MLNIGETKEFEVDYKKVEEIGSIGYAQSLEPFKGTKGFESVAILGLDTEYVSRPGKPSELICWQLSYENKAMLFEKELTLKTLYSESRKLVCKDVDHLVFVTYFARAEIQFFDLMDWTIGETGDTYTLDQSYLGRMLHIVDLAPWYNLRPLRMVADLWNLKKLDYPIKEKVEAIARGDLTIKELLEDKEFRTYALNDALITQQLYIKMRDYFLKEWGIDVIAARTIAQAAAWIFRKKLDQPIQPKDSWSRKLALMCCWGGRMELITPGEKELVYEYDAVGHHPNSAIALGILPRGEDWRSTINCEDWLSGISGFGKVFFEFPKSELYPCLPVFHNDNLVFPLKGISHCTVSEARYAIELGAKLFLGKGSYYQTGTDVLTKHLLDLQKRREATQDFAYRELLKLLSNSLIGKFFQKRTQSDLAAIQRYAREYQIPLEVVSTVMNFNCNEKITGVGASYYPEWYGLILGHARSSIARVARNSQALVISSDSFVTQKELAPEFISDGITFKLKLAGDYVGYRSRFYRVGDKYAHHAVHERESAKVVLDKFLKEKRFEYKLERILNLRESWRRKLPFGSILEQDMTVSLDYDFKRKLLPDGSTVPWEDVKVREEFLRLHKTSQLRLF